MWYIKVYTPGQAENEKWFLHSFNLSQNGMEVLRTTLKDYAMTIDSIETGKFLIDFLKKFSDQTFTISKAS